MKRETSKTSSQRREKGNERRRQVLASTRVLLERRALEDIGLSDIAKETGIPVSSLYHFYPKILDVYAELIAVFSVELSAHLMRSLENVCPETWQQLVDKGIDSCAEFYAINPAYQQLILSGKAPAQVKSADREGDARLAQALKVFMSNFFDMPRIPHLDNVFFNALEIVDLLLSLSVMQNGEITSSGIKEAKRACKSYLRTYLPEILYPV